MTPERREELRLRLRRAGEAAAKRGQKIVGYVFENDVFRFTFGPLRVKRKQPIGTTECDWYYGGECTCGTRHRTRRGVEPAGPAQGSLI